MPQKLLKESKDKTQIDENISKLQKRTNIMHISIF